ncbi:MAG: Phosphoenolpyruvate-protein phosphotransferase of system [Clostridiales bacterium]|jgi:phosphotransferase system enzyme I (PtsI)|nr:Phosphoenolpyruvate-protein phosphotransferase of system [Clostridiales bacterium]
MEKIHIKKTSSDGIAIGQAMVVQIQEYSPEKYPITKDDIKQEETKFYEAMDKAQAEIAILAENSDIFEGHSMMVTDVMLRDTVLQIIQDEIVNVQIAVNKAYMEYMVMFEAMEDEYLRERGADIKDVRNRIIRILQKREEVNLSNLANEVIVVAKDLSPSDTATMDLDHVLGFITEEGGVTSHVCIMAKSIGIPALVGVSGIMKQVVNKDTIAMDAGKGIIVINPDEATLEEYRNLERLYKLSRIELEKSEKLEAITLDGREIKIFGNAGNIEDIDNANKHNVSGIGLFRSEFLYMENKNFPTEEEQFDIYKEAAQKCTGEITIRTLDIGGDKELPYYRFDQEENPYLGWRAIRISLDLVDVFKAQLKAILRASAFGHIRIMYPMIISIEELEQANTILSECKEELREKGCKFDEEIEVGMMIETPASVLLVEEFAQLVDFFSIGTNDLTQYLLAVDRGNNKISHMYNSFHPAVIKAIKKIIDAAHSNQVSVGMCGEFAGDETATKLLLGLGLDEFSMSVGQTGKIKKLICNTSYQDAEKLAHKVLTCKKTSEIELLVLEESR